MKAKVFLALGSLLVGLLGMEVLFRAAAAGFDLDNAPPKESSFVYGASIGYELKPHAQLSFRDEYGWRFYETMNAEGFRGSELDSRKPAGTYRILALGDSVVEAMTVRRAYTWETVLEERLNARAQPGRHYQVINSGIGGYVSWQAEQRLIRHGLTYRPDLVITLVGWNDFVYSTLPIWKPGLELSQIEEAYLPLERVPLKQDPWSRMKRKMAAWSYLYRLMSHHRNFKRFEPIREQIIRQRQTDSHQPLNTKAIALYRQNLEAIHDTCCAAGARMALVTWPTLLAPELFNDSIVQHRLIKTYQHFPLSTRELWMGYLAYQGVQREFARRHPDVLFIDLAQESAAMPRAERLRRFVDLAHLSKAGNRWFAGALELHLQNL